MGCVGWAVVVRANFIGTRIGDPQATRTKLNGEFLLAHHVVHNVNCGFSRAATAAWTTNYFHLFHVELSAKVNQKHLNV